MLKTLNQQDDLDVIILHMQGRLNGNYILSAALEEKMKLLSDCRDLIRQYGSRVKVTKMLMQQKPGMSRSTAERIFGDTMFVFNTTQTSNRDFWIDIVIGSIMQTREKALSGSNLKVVAMCDANLAKVISLMTDEKDKELYDRINVARRVVLFGPELTNVTLPDNWKEQVDSIIAEAKKRNTAGIPDAQIDADEIPGE